MLHDPNHGRRIRRPALFTPMRLALLAVLAVPVAIAPAGPTAAQAGPTLTSISPDQAQVGASVTLNGANLVADASVTTIQFGTTEVDSANCSTDACTITIPALPGTGTVDVTVSTSFGTSNALPFTYAPLGPPTLSAVDPNQSDANGTTSVTFTGNGFSTVPGATTFQVAQGLGYFFTNVSCAGPTQCTALGPVIALDCGQGGSGFANFFADTLTVSVNGVTGSLDVDYTVYKPCDGSVDEPNPGIGDSDGVIIDADGDGLADTGASEIVATTIGGMVLLFGGLGLLAVSRRRGR